MPFSLLKKYLEMIRFSHTLFAMPFALLAAVMAWFLNENPFRWLDLAGMLLAMIFARSAAMAFNRLADRDIDAKNPRTAGRHLPAETLGVAGVIGFTVFCSLGFIASTLCFLPGNPLPLAFSVPVLIFLFSYSLMKRYTVFVHFFLGVALMLAPLAAWVAIRGTIFVQAWQNGWQTLGMAEFSPFLLATAVFFWSAGFDIIYACMDADFDRESGVYSIPGRLGTRTALRLAAMCHLLVPVPLFALCAVFPHFRTIWCLAVAGVACLLIYEHRIVDPKNPVKVNVAFFYVNVVISMALLLAGGVEIFRFSFFE